MDVELVGANKHATVIAEKKQAYYENHFTAAVAGGNGARAYTYGKIIYKNVYPHIDWAIYTLNGQLKQEFVINKGGKVADIQLRYGGATSINLGNNGSFTTATPMGVITEHAPYSYQADGKAVASKFRLTGDVLGFETGSYSGTLVIDPTLVWAIISGHTMLTMRFQWLQAHPAVCIYAVKRTAHQA